MQPFTIKTAQKREKQIILKKKMEAVCVIAEQGELEPKLQLYETYRKTERKKTNYWTTIAKVQQELEELKQCQATFMDDCQKEELLKKQRDLEIKINKGYRKLQRCRVQFHKKLQELEELKQQLLQ